MKTTVVIFGIFWVSLAFANGSKNGPFWGEQPTCDHCPEVPIAVNDNPSFDQLDQAYQEGTLPTSQDLTGNWKLVLAIYSPEAKDHFYFADSTAIGANENGLKNPLDRSDSAGLSFQSDDQQNPWVKEPTVIKVTLSNLRRRSDNQGPNLVTFTQKDACFARYSYYTDNGQQDDDMFYDYDCRLISSNRMLCAIIPMGAADGNQAPYLNQNIKYMGYKKVVR